MLFRKELFLIYAYIIELIVLGIMLYHLHITKKPDNSLLKNPRLNHSFDRLDYISSSKSVILFPFESNILLLSPSIFWVQVTYFIMRVATSLSKQASTSFWKIWKNIGL